MKKLAGRDFEDLLQVCFVLLWQCSYSSICLQCSIPVFEGLLPPPHNEIILDLLFVLSTWHAYTKLRLHTNTTLNSFNTTTTKLGQFLHLFVSKTCSVFKTREPPREEAARGRRNAVMRAKKGTAKGKEKAARTDAKAKTFNLCTYKLHALGDYVNAIWCHGTTDNYNTQVVSALDSIYCSLFDVDFVERVSLSIDVSKDFMHKPTKSNLNDKLLGSSGSESYARYVSGVKRQRVNLKLQVHRPTNQNQLQFSLKDPTCCHTQCPQPTTMSQRLHDIPRTSQRGLQQTKVTRQQRCVRYLTWSL